MVGDRGSRMEQNEWEKLAKQDSREYYYDNTVDCPCDAAKACLECVESGLYDGDEQLPPPPDVIYAHGYMDDEQEAYYAGLNIPCTGYTEGCLCGGCTAETYRYSINMREA